MMLDSLTYRAVCISSSQRHVTAAVRLPLSLSLSSLLLSPQVTSPGTVAAGALSVLAVVGIVIVSVGSIVRTNKPAGGGASGSGDTASNSGTGLLGVVSKNGSDFKNSCVCALKYPVR